MNKKIMCLSAIALSLSLGQTAFAAQSGMQPASKERFEQIADKLNLAPDQKEKIKAIREKAETAIQPLVKSLHALRLETNNLLTAATLDEAKLDSVIEQEKNAIGSILKTRAMERHDISGLLTDQQKTAFSGMIEQWEHKNLGLGQPANPKN